MSDQKQSVQAEVEHTSNVQERNDDIDDDDCTMPQRAGTDNALEEAMSFELDIEPVSPHLQSHAVPATKAATHSEV